MLYRIAVLPVATVVAVVVVVVVVAVAVSFVVAVVAGAAVVEDDEVACLAYSRQTPMPLPV